MFTKIVYLLNDFIICYSNLELSERTCTPFSENIFKSKHLGKVLDALCLCSSDLEYSILCLVTVSMILILSLIKNLFR